MKNLFKVRAFAFASPAIFCALALASPAKPVSPAYHIAATWKIAGNAFWDYLSLDASGRRLFVPRDTRIQVLDTRTGQQIGQVEGLQAAHGVAFAPGSGLAFATSGGQNRVVAFDLRTLAPAGTIPVGDGPDAILYEPATDQILSMNGEGKSVSFIQVATKKVVATTRLPSNPESAATDGKGTVWINLEGSSQIAQLNARTHQLVRVFPLSPGQEPTGLAYDARTGHLFAGCGNKTLIVLDAKSGKILAHLPIGAGVDAGSFDPQTRLSFSPAGRSGTLSIVGERGGKPALLATVPTRMGARTMALDPLSHAIYVLSADYQPLRPGQRYPEAVPGSIRVLKLEPGAK